MPSPIAANGGVGVSALRWRMRASSSSRASDASTPRCASSSAALQFGFARIPSHICSVPTYSCPRSALDNESEILVGQSLDKLAKGRTTLTIAHRLTTIKNADRILVLGKSGIEEEGRHEELLAKKGIYYRLWNGLVSGQTL